MSKNTKERLPYRAAAYVRMSAEHQQYSVSDQLNVIRKEAKRRSLNVVKHYSDPS